MMNEKVFLPKKENIPTWLRLLRPWVECGNYDFGFILDQSATAPPNTPITYSSSASIASRVYVSQWFAHLLLDSAAPGLIPSFSKNFRAKIVDVAEFNQRQHLQESGQVTRKW